MDYRARCDLFKSKFSYLLAGGLWPYYLLSLGHAFFICKMKLKSLPYCNRDHLLSPYCNSIYLAFISKKKKMCVCKSPYIYGLRSHVYEIGFLILPHLLMTFYKLINISTFRYLLTCTNDRAGIPEISLPKFMPSVINMLIANLTRLLRMITGFKHLSLCLIHKSQ